MTDELTLAFANTLSWEELAAAFAAAYEGYSIDLPIGPEWLRRHCQDHDVDLARSPLYLDQDQTPQAVALLGLRQNRAWVGGFGVAREWRGRGVSHRLIADCISQARLAGAEQLQLEVLENNTAAQATYYRAGFTFRRHLAVMAGPRLECPSVAAGEPCWQREKAAPSGTLERLVNEPEGSPLHRALLERGWREVLRQREMVLALREPQSTPSESPSAIPWPRSNSTT